MTKKTAVSETSQCSTSNRFISNSNLSLLSMEDIIGWRERGLTDSQVTTLCKNMIKWSLLDTSIDLIGFCSAQGIAYETFRGYRKQHEKFAKVAKVVKEIIGERLNRYSTFKKYECNEKTIHMTIAEYHPIWKEVFKDEREFKKEMAMLKVTQENKKPTHLTILMDNYGTNNSTDKTEQIPASDLPA